MISIVCVYNNEDIYEKFLLKSLGNQTVDFELIRIDNTKKKFNSAAQAYNYAGEKSKGKYIMFVHQDVQLTSDNWLEQSEKILDSIKSLGIAGVIGVSEYGNNITERFRNIINHGEHHVKIGNPINCPTIVQTLDECLFIIPKTVFSELKFDEEVITDWHLYAVDYSLTVRDFCLDAYVIPLSIYHLSSGDGWLFKPGISRQKFPGIMLDDYYYALAKVLRKHKRKFYKIYTTAGEGVWNTMFPLMWQQTLRALDKRYFRRFRIVR